jgi:5'-nucleotidase
MTIILTNDDGIDAPGIQALQKALADNNSIGIAPTTIIIAPNTQYSGCGHQVSTHRAIQVKKSSPTAYAVDGTPADCTRLAIHSIAPNTKWVLSGINAGGNLGTDVYISGTVAAVREAAMHGIGGIAISHWIKRPLIIDWDWATYWTGKVLADLMNRPLVPGTFWNVNLPHLEAEVKEPEIVFCQPSIDPLPVNFRIEGDLHYYQGEYSKRDRTLGTDVDVCFSGNISVTQISL